ncbi:MAG: hypothetical protein R2705_12710 [Ilumatobacteraceae bacterium]
MSAIRLSRTVAAQDVTEYAAVAEFPTTVVTKGRTWDLRVSEHPGLFAVGRHVIECQASIDQQTISGEFELVVGPGDAAPAHWTVLSGGEVGGLELLDREVVEQLPRSMSVPALAGASLRRAVRRVIRTPPSPAPNSSPNIAVSSGRS